MSISLGDIVKVKGHTTRWTVSYVEGNKIYCYHESQHGHYSSIVIDVSMLEKG